MNRSDRLLEETIRKIYESKTKLEELARTKDFIANELHYDSKSAILHLIKLLLFQNVGDDCKNHWITEITASLYHTYRIKGTNKYPTYKQLHKWFLDDDLEQLYGGLNQLVKKAAADEKIAVPEYNKDKLYESIANYLDWVCQKLAEAGSIEESVMENKLAELYNNYK